MLTSYSSRRWPEIRTKKEWEFHCRRVRKGEPPAEVRVRVCDRSIYGRPPLNDTDLTLGRRILAAEQTPSDGDTAHLVRLLKAGHLLETRLYAESQTEALPESDPKARFRTHAQALQELFFAGSHDHHHIRKTSRAKWTAKGETPDFLAHLLGTLTCGPKRGEATSWLVADLDRHASEDRANVPTADHLRRVQSVAAWLDDRYPLLAEINPANGSIKLWAFLGRPAPVAEAQELARQMIEDTGVTCECYPLTPQVFCPLMPSKVTFIGDRPLPQVAEGRYAGAYDVTRLERHGDQLWLYRGRTLSGHECWAVLSPRGLDRKHFTYEVKRSCGNLPDPPQARRVRQRPRREPVGDFIITAEDEAFLAALRAEIRGETSTAAALAPGEMAPTRLPAPAALSPSPAAPRPPPEAVEKPAPPQRLPTAPLAPAAVPGPVAANPDSFRRQLDALLLLARRNRRVPELAEALDFIRQAGLYTGTWRENEEQREARVRWLLEHIARTFDPGKCGAGKVDVGKYRAWCQKRFPVRLPVKRLHVARGQYRPAGTLCAEDVAVYLAIFDFCLKSGQIKQDRGIPHRRVSQLWQALHRSGATRRSVSDLKIRAIREWLAQHEVIAITDRNYCPQRHVSMKYDYGKFYPFLGRWKARKDRQKCKLACRGKKFYFVRESRLYATSNGNENNNNNNTPILLTQCIYTCPLNRPGEESFPSPDSS